MTTEREAQHTPGPWGVSVSGDAVVGPRGNVVAECCGYSVLATDPAQRAQGGREANARLIAAAPDLLAACEAAESLLDCAASDLAEIQFDEQERAKSAELLAECAAECRAVIARARGEVTP